MRGGGVDDLHRSGAQGRLAVRTLRHPATLRPRLSAQLQPAAAPKPEVSSLPQRLQPKLGPTREHAPEFPQAPTEKRRTPATKTCSRQAMADGLG